MNFMELLPWICSGFSILGSILNIYKKKICFIIWSIGNMGFIAWDIKFHAYGQLPVWIIFTACNIYGYWKWNKEE